MTAALPYVWSNGKNGIANEDEPGTKHTRGCFWNLYHTKPSPAPYHFHEGMFPPSAAEDSRVSPFRTCGLHDPSKSRQHHRNDNSQPHILLPVTCLHNATHTFIRVLDCPQRSTPCVNPDWARTLGRGFSAILYFRMYTHHQCPALDSSVLPRA